MNERLREFVRESNLDVYGLGKERYKWEYTVEKFAELIVRECADIATINSHQWHSAGRFVLTHFGVEE